MTIPKTFVGKWRITHMDMWDQDFVDLVVPGHFTFRNGGMGSFQFGAVEGAIDCRIEEVGDAARLAFTWHGSDDNDEACGRGWFQVAGSEAIGHIFFHRGDDSGFKGKKRR